MDYPAALQFLYEQLPMFQRQGPIAFKKDLTNTLELCRLLDQPQKRFRSIHVAGTNGKGSVSHLIAAVLQAAGYKVGLYTSPHYKDFRERIKINGEFIDEPSVINFVAAFQEDFKRIEPSFFEITVSMAFDHFARERVDFAVIETGLGGRLDSTNVISPILSVITNIGYEHTQFLGDTLPAIAYEKAGIIKEDTPVVIGETDPETAPVFIRVAEGRNAPICFADQLYRLDLTGKQPGSMRFNVYAAGELLYQEIEGGLYGNYQLKNLATTLCALEQLSNLNIPIHEEAVRSGLKDVVQLTRFMGRFQIMSEKPLVICDSAHNYHGLAAVLHELEELTSHQIHIVLGVVKDKDLTRIFETLPEKAHYYFCKPDIPRGLEEDVLKAKASRMNLKGDSYGSVQQAYKAALSRAGEDDLVFVGGSAFVVAEVL